MATYVLVHGAGHGGWCWQRVALLLRAVGHEVHTPTLTGLGDRAHLLSPDVSLETHIADIAAVLSCEDLREAILVGHSYGGIVITGAADRAPDRVGQLVFLDAAILKHGESLAAATPAIRAVRDDSRTVGGVELVLWPDQPVARAIYGVSDESDWAWMAERLRPHPWRCFAEPLMLANAEKIAQLPRTIINCPSTLKLRAGEVLDRYFAADRVWEIDTGHDTMITEPEKTAELLLRLADMGR
jgi:pimeloyl-ACP methyl ester carboxylesterase